MASFPIPIISRVQDTNYDAQISKLSCVQRGYFQDPYVRHFVRHPVRRPPLINRGYFARYSCVTNVVARFLSATSGETSGGDTDDRPRPDRALGAGPAPSLPLGPTERVLFPAAPGAGGPSSPSLGSLGGQRPASMAATGRTQQILSLGAGFDTLYWQLCERGARPGAYFELDLPDVVQKKREIVEKVPALADAVREGSAAEARAAATGGEEEGEGGGGPDRASGGREEWELWMERGGERSAGAPRGPDPGPAPAPVLDPRGTGARPGPLPADAEAASRKGGDPPPETRAATAALRGPAYRLVPGDLRDWGACWRSLLAAGLDPSLPTLVLAECVLVYLPPESAHAILGGLARDLVSVAVLTYDPTLPDDPFGSRMVDNLALRGAPLLGIRGAASPAAARERLLTCGYDGAQAVSMLEAYSTDSLVDPRYRAHIQRLEFLDELEEWNLLMGHYCLALGVKGGELVRSLTL